MDAKNPKRGAENPPDFSLAGDLGRFRQNHRRFRRLVVRSPAETAGKNVKITFFLP